jgi:hypothetical protein
VSITTDLDAIRERYEMALESGNGPDAFAALESVPFLLDLVDELQRQLAGVLAKMWERGAP